MLTTIVVAASENNVIGIDNELPWHLPDDLKFFKQKTLEKPVLMGRKTFESLGRPLPKRLNIVLSHGNVVLPEGVLLYSSLNEALDFLKTAAAPEVCIIGGGIVFAAALPIVQQIFLTRVHTQVDGGTAFFPELPVNEWELIWEEHHVQDEKHDFAFTFQQYKRKA